MTKVIQLSRGSVSGVTRSNNPEQLQLPFFCDSYVGVVWHVRADRISVPKIDKLYRRFHLMGIVDFRGFPILGNSPHVHRTVCKYLGKGKLHYLRFSDIRQSVENEALFAFNRKAVVTEALQNHVEASNCLRECLSAGSLINIVSEGNMEQGYLELLLRGIGLSVEIEKHLAFID